MIDGFQNEALAEAREQYGRYFDALEKHPYSLQGTEVPAVGREGVVRLGSTAEARDWQEAVKAELAADIRDRASRQLDEQRSVLNTLHASVELFQKNPDLTPGTTGFDRDLADQFAAMVKPYELRVEGKLHGYSIPVQPLIDSLRTQVHAGRAAAPAASAAPAAGGSAPTAQAPAAATPPPASPGEQPQAGIPSRSGTGAEGEDFSTLFGTIGLPHLQI